MQKKSDKANKQRETRDDTYVTYGFETKDRGDLGKKRQLVYSQGR